MGWCWSSGTEFTKAFKSACAGSGKRRKAWKMKWLLHAAIGTLLAIAAEAEAAEPAPIHKAPAVIAVDGVLDEPAWKQAEVVKADYVWGQVGRRSAQRQMRVRYTWDDHYLYVGYETFDRNLMALGTGKKEGPRDNLREGCAIVHPTRKPDVVEFFISFGDLRFFWEVHHNAANQFNDIWCVVVDKRWPISKSSMNRYGIQLHHREYVQDDATTARRLATAVTLKPKADGKPSTINDPSDVDVGYTGELRLPWLGLGAPLDRETWVNVPKADSKLRPRRHRGPWKMAGQEIRILAVVQNGDLKERYHHSSPTKPGDWFHKGAEHYPRYVLQAESVRRARTQKDRAPCEHHTVSVLARGDSRPAGKVVLARARLDAHGRHTTPAPLDRKKNGHPMTWKTLDLCRRRQR